MVNEYYIFFPLECTCVLIILILFIYLYFKIRDHRSHKYMHPFYPYTNIFCLLLYLIAILVDCIHIGLSAFVTTEYKVYDQHYGNVKIIADIAFFSSTTLLYIIMIGRLILTFNNTLYKLNKCLISIIFVFIFISNAGMIYYVISLKISSNIEKLDKRDQPVIAIIGGFDLVLNLILLFIFVLKIRQLVISIQDCDFEQFVNVNNKRDMYRVCGVTPSPTKSKDTVVTFSSKSSKSISGRTSPTSSAKRNFFTKSPTFKRFIALDKNQRKLITVITRHSILSSIAIIANLTYYTSLFIDFYSPKSNISSLMNYGIRGISSTIIVITLCLNFGFNMKIYSFCCGKCHFGCYKICVSFTKTSIKQDIEQDQSEQIIEKSQQTYIKLET